LLLQFLANNTYLSPHFSPLLSKIQPQFWLHSTIIERIAQKSSNGFYNKTTQLPAGHAFWGHRAGAKSAEREVAGQQAGTPSPKRHVLREATGLYLSQNGYLTSPVALLYFPYNKIELC
jgi:hypothetical protein